MEQFIQFKEICSIHWGFVRSLNIPLLFAIENMKKVSVVHLMKIMFGTIRMKGTVSVFEDYKQQKKIMERKRKTAPINGERKVIRS